MKRFTRWVIVAGLLAGLSTYGEEELTSPMPENTAVTNSADVLWAGMHEIGMIDDEQYQYVLENGFLPGGSTLTNSPVPVDEQAGWSRLSEHGVITPEELAYLLYKGTIPDMDEEELNALAELAPVYQPNRAKRLTYAVRRKHARVELIRLARRFHEEHAARTANLEERAAAFGFPLKRGKAVLVGIDENDEPIYIEPDGIGACDTISADEVWTTNAVGNINTNFNLTGAGVVLAMWEEGRPNTYHQEFAGRITYKTTQYFHGHANAVAGVMMGAGIETNAQGVAPRATLHAYSYDDASAKEDLTNVANDGLIRFSNHSYHFSDIQKNGLYTDVSFERDEIVYAAYYHLPVLTVSNERKPNSPQYVTLANGVAKNCLSVGAVEEIPGGYAGTNSVVMTSYSGWGPTHDGRIKPDVVAGEWSGWIPADYTNYHEYGEVGTSYAAPAVTGSLGLLQQHYENLNGTNAVPLLASTWKALLIHSADEAGAYPGPDYSFGWGLVNVRKAAELMTTDAQWGGDRLIKEFTLANGDRSFFNVRLDGSEPLKITIAWTDPPGPVLVNDIDLRIIGPDDTVFEPFFFDLYATNFYQVSRGDNHLDNVEQVVITNTVAGFYQVVVDHKVTLVDTNQNVCGQAVSMVLSESAIPVEPVGPTNLSISVSSNGLPRLEWEALVGSLQVVISSDTLFTPSSLWTTNSTLSIISVTNEWVDPAGFSDPARFYRIKGIE